MRIALLGFGKVAESTHVPGFAALGDRFQIVAVAEPSPERRARAAIVLPHARIYDAPEKLLATEREIDAVDVAVPPFLHAPLVLAAVKAGRHVLCEKPLGLDEHEVAAIVDEARVRDRVVYTVNNWRHAPLVDEAIRRASQLGKVRFFAWSVRRVAADPGAAVGGKTWREDPKLALGGILVDHGWHALTVVHALLGNGRRTVRAQLVEEPGKADVEARVRIAQGDARVTIRLTWRARRRANRARLVAERGSLRLEDDRLVEKVRSRSQTGAWATERADRSFPEKLSQGSTHPEWFPPVLRAFLDEVEGRIPRGQSLDEARACMLTIQAAYASAARKCSPVVVDG